MDSTNVNANPVGGEKSKKAGTVKKVAGDAAKFAGAAGLGVAATMAVNAMDTDEDVQQGGITSGIEGAPLNTTSEELHAESVTEFNPNDIMIEPDEDSSDDGMVDIEGVADNVNPEDVAVIEPQPITGEEFLVNQPGEVILAEDDPFDEPSVDADTDGDEDFDNDEDQFADNDDMSNDIDIADDILA